ncbi:hypothetical protein [Escherichia coli IS1]|nr:hypothetical protein [Escherichia coli IS1]
MSCAHGLSPLARGTPRHAGRAAIPPRFIPAGAGNSFSSSSIAVVLTVYPRWRGELLIRSSYSAPLAGLSPLARGTQHGRPYEIPVARFIPAGAGNSNIPGDNQPAYSVYPRWRGELEERGEIPAGRARFIPAGAGNSKPIFTRLLLIAVYPRWRGEL